MATLHDVADRAKVSHTAVSAVINNVPGRVSEQTRQRILKAIRELNYRPNRIARQLVSGKSDAILVCFTTDNPDDFMSPDANQLSAGIWKSAIKSDYSLLFAPIVAPESDMEKVVVSIESRSVDGAIVLGPIPRKKHLIEAIDNTSVPIVCIDSYPDFVNTTTVDTDNREGMKQGVQCLISQGHERIMYFGPTPVYQCDIDRLCGFSEAIDESILPVDEHMIKLIPVDCVKNTLREAMNSDYAPTAVICSGYLYGVAVWEVFREMGISVPGDVTMLSFDILPPGHEGLNSVISFKLPWYKMGKAAMEALNDIIKGDMKEAVKIRLAPELVMPKVS